MGLSLHEAWRISPRTLWIVTKARNEVALDELDQRIQAAFAGEFFHRENRLSHRSLTKMLPKRKRPSPAQNHGRTIEEEIRIHDAWAHGVNARIARAEAAQKEADAKRAAKVAARAERQRQKGQGA